MSNETVSSNTLDKRSTVIAVIIIGAMFFIFGLVSWVNATFAALNERRLLSGISRWPRSLHSHNS